MTRHLLGLAALITVGIVYPFLFPAYLTVAITILLFAGWATAWDILGGWNGQVRSSRTSL
jgi:branched-chain amino acid transport system permease protein